MFNKISSVMRRELSGYFSSPTALIFLATYLLTNLFIFFIVEKFFARNIADLRPLFEWMPILLIFLISTLTMKMWSDEKRMGTIEFLLTLPTKIYELVLGKFLACMALVTIALSLTLGLALMVGNLGPVDWGPIVSAYLATLLLAASYTAVGLYISSRCESQIVSLIMTTVICSAFYLIGENVVHDLLGNMTGEVLRLLGTGSRFEAISRGVLDVRDVYYYLSIAGAFLVLNIHSLQKIRWSYDAPKPSHKALHLVTILVCVNLLAANVWLYKVQSARIDLTKNQQYSISEATRNIIDQLQEPLLIRGYFSERTHPKLAPFVPEIRDLMQEYELVSGGKIRSEFIDPRKHPELEAEANKKYKIEPTPFQIQDKYSASMVASYFNIMIKYGDKHEVLGFNDLIEIKHDGLSKLDIKLRNLEYDMTRSIKKVLQSFSNTDNLFEKVKNKIKFVAYVTENKLPKQLETLLGDVKSSLKTYEKNSNGKLEVQFLNPDKDQRVANEITKKYGFKPQMMSLLAQETFYFYMTLQANDQIYLIGIPENLKIDTFNESLENTLKRIVPGFLKTVGIYTPPAQNHNPMMAQFGMPPNSGPQYNSLQQKVMQNYSTQNVDLNSGMIPEEIDLLLVLSPKELNKKQVFALDQFLMKGGSIVLVSSPVNVSMSRSGFNVKEVDSGLNDWLAHHGMTISKKLVLDKNNIGFPEFRKRNVQGVTITEPYIAPYPMLVDVRNTGLEQENLITSGLGQLTMAWASPIEVNTEKNKNRTITHLVRSSDKSWATDTLEVDTNRNLYPKLGFAEGEKQESFTLASMVEGKFTSFFKGEKSPLIEEKKEEKVEDKDAEKKEAESKEEEKTGVITSVIETSSTSSRLIVFASNDFVSDDLLKLAGMVQGTQYINSLQAIENSLDWSSQDRDLMSIRGRGHFAATLVSMEDKDRQFWEILNYIMALFGLLCVYLIARLYKSRSKAKYEAWNLG